MRMAINVSKSATGGRERRRGAVRLDHMCSRLIFASLAFIALACAAPPATAEPPSESALRQTLAAFDATTRTGGGGPDAYATYLHPGFTAWNITNGTHTAREEVVSGLGEWWAAGNSVGVDDSEVLGVSMAGSIASVRLRAAEQFVDASGASAGAFSGYVIQTWIHDGRAWTLFSSASVAAD